MRQKSIHIKPNIEIDKKYLHLSKEEIKNEIQKCKNGFDGLVYQINNYIYVKNKIPIDMMNKKWFRHIKFEGDKINLSLYPKQKEILYNFYHYRLNAVYKSRQTGISTITKCFVLQYATFNNNKEIIIVSKSETEAITFLNDIYFMYNNLPFFLRRPYSKAVVKSFQLGDLNKCTKISVLTSTTKSGRSFTATILVLDECEFIEKVDILQGASQPTLSATGGKAILISTPYEYNSQFYKICHTENNGFVKSSIHWSEIPNRDEEQYEQQCKELNYDKLRIQTELDMEQIIPYQTYFLEKYFDHTMVLYNNQSLEYNPEYNLHIFYDYTSNLEYFFGIDPFEGGNDYNSGIIIDNLNRINAIFKTKRTDIKNIIKYLCEKYNVKCNIERNKGFQLIKEFYDEGTANIYLLKQKEQKNKSKILSYGYFLKDNRNDVLSYISSQLDEIQKYNNKHKYKKIKIPQDLYNELKKFVVKKTKVEGLEHDDLIFALGASLFVKNNKHLFINLYTKKKEIKSKKRNSKIKYITTKNGIPIIKNKKKYITLKNIMKKSTLTIEDLNNLEVILNHKKED